MNTNEKIFTGFLLVVATLGSVGINSLLDESRATYECVSKGLVSDCINGVKACSDGICTRCYYSIENTAKYEYCKEGWKEIVNELVPVSEVSSGTIGQKYLCDQTKCTLIS
jgi:hypothetical protein